HIGESTVEEESLDAGGEADQIEQKRTPVVTGAQRLHLEDRVDPSEAELCLAADRRDGLHGGERLGPLALVRHIRVEQRQIELDVYRLLEQLPGEVQPGFGRVDVLVQVQYQIVRHDGVAGREECDESVHEVFLGRREPGQVLQVGVQI